MVMQGQEITADLGGLASPPNIFHAAVGRLLEEVTGAGLHGNERMRGPLRDRLIEYAVSVRGFFARAVATGEAASEARALKAELREAMKGKSAAEVLRAMGDVDAAVRERVDRAERETRDSVLSELTSASSGVAQVVAAAGAAWHEMDVFLRGS